jgi:bacterioferritin-associated ferredoxin
MYVCVCRSVTDRQIRDAASRGVRDLASLREQLGVASNCGRCAECALSILGTGSGLDAGVPQAPHENLP